jgi:hypothetical protein
MGRFSLFSAFSAAEKRVRPDTSDPRDRNSEFRIPHSHDRAPRQRR